METEDFVCAIMDDVIKTRNYQRNIMKDDTIDICRACHCPRETFKHIVSGCSHLDNGEYLHRRNQVAKILALATCSSIWSCGIRSAFL